ncbi:MAG: ECF-type sigma factor [Phycisphaerales bacterium JB059]
MGAPEQDRLTKTLHAAATGDTGAARDLLVLVYDELRALARARMAGAPPGQTLQPTALVHEAYMRIVGEGDAQFEGRRHFFFAAARAMRDIVVEDARRKSALKRGGDRRRESLDDPPFELTIPPDEILALSEALDRLEGEDAESARIVGLRFFVGLSNQQISEILGVSLSTVERRWRFTRAWLASSLSDETLSD